MFHAALASAGITRITFLAKGYALVVALTVFLSTSGCSVRNFAVNSMGDALAASGSGFGSDDDPELISAAAPFSLKLMESVLAESPGHRGLLLAATQGFVQYAYAFVEMRADEIEDRDLQAAYAQRERARRLYLRARNYGLRGLESAHPGIGRLLKADPVSAVARATEKDTALLYWTGVAWAAAISLSKDDPFLVADLPVAEALVRRALALEETYDHGTIHVFLISYEMSRAGLSADAPARARRHFERAVDLTGGLHAAPFVTLAESVAIAERNRPEFEQLLRRALALDTGARAEWRLVNTVMQRRARWLLARTDKLFAD
ncbi:MAG TPA: TRAP transporter TatT component family protein [Burkholderiales bacterium]|nr:TRAP transporter TatT component family protein [Burkholderiales bacterium]